MGSKTASLCCIGGRSSNDDTVRIQARGQDLCVFVGDGLGAYSGGALASQVAAEAMLEAHRWGSLLEDRQLAAAVEQADQAVKKLQKERNGTMKTTMVTLVIEDGRAKWAHVGDSRLYHFRCGWLQQQTVDHSVSQMAVMTGQIRPDQIRTHQDRNRILQALGGPVVKADVSNTVMLTGGEDVFLLCTDGFWEYVFEEEMEQLLKESSDPQQWLEAMEALRLERAPADSDNYTAAAVFY